MVDSNMGLWAQLALSNPDAAAGMLAASGITPTGSVFDPGVGGVVAPSDAGGTAPTGGAGPDQASIMRGLSGASAVTQPQMPRAQYIPPAPLPRAASASVNPSQVIAQIAPLLLQQTARQNVPTLAQLISGA